MDGTLFPSVGSWSPSPPRAPGCARWALAARRGCVWASRLLVATGRGSVTQREGPPLASASSWASDNTACHPETSPSGAGPHPLAQVARGEEGLRGASRGSTCAHRPSAPRPPAAIAMLRDKEPGAFVVRDSHSFRGAYGLAMKVATPPPSVLQLNKKGGYRPPRPGSVPALGTRCSQVSSWYLSSPVHLLSSVLVRKRSLILCKFYFLIERVALPTVQGSIRWLSQVPPGAPLRPAGMSPQQAARTRFLT